RAATVERRRQRRIRQADCGIARGVGGRDVVVLGIEVGAVHGHRRRGAFGIALVGELLGVGLDAATATRRILAGLGQAAERVLDAIDAIVGEIVGVGGGSVREVGIEPGRDANR